MTIITTQPYIATSETQVTVTPEEKQMYEKRIAALIKLLKRRTRKDPETGVAYYALNPEESEIIMDFQDEVSKRGMERELSEALKEFLVYQSIDSILPPPPPPMIKRDTEPTGFAKWIAKMEAK